MYRTSHRSCFNKRQSISYARRNYDFLIMQLSPFLSLLSVVIHLIVLAQITPVPIIPVRWESTEFYDHAKHFFLWRKAGNESGPPNCWGFLIAQKQTHIHTHRTGLLWTSDQLVAETATYTTQETSILAVSGIRTRYLSNRSAAELRLKPRGQRNRHTKHRVL